MIGTHNSLTYAKPKSKWAYLIRFIWRNQERDIISQIEQGATAFDIRFAPVRGGWASAHGAVTLDISPIKAIHAINDRCPGAYIRIILEKGGERSFAAFKEICIHLEKAYPRLNFFGGNYKPTWKQLHNFNRPCAIEAERSLYQHIGSMQSKWGKVFPWLWAMTHKRLPVSASSKELPIVFTDFI